MKVITKENFNKEVLESKKVVLVDVWAPWCPPCRSMMPLIEELSEEVKDKADVVKLDAQDEPELAQLLNVSALPTFLLFKDGKVVDSNIGATSKANLLNMISKVS
ncbi:MAG: thioredoxin [Candidatus Saccharimonadales bacterium]